MAGHRKGEKAAVELLDECWDGSLPIDPVRIAKSLGVKVLDTYLKQNVSGALVKKQGEDPSIVLNAEDSTTRKRFTCAHELGHYIRRAGEREHQQRSRRSRRRAWNQRQLGSAGTDASSVKEHP